MIWNCFSGFDECDATSSTLTVPDFAKNLKATSELDSQPLQGKRLAIITETLGAGVDLRVLECIKEAVSHLGSLGAEVDEVRHCRNAMHTYIYSIWFGKLECAYCRHKRQQAVPTSFTITVEIPSKITLIDYVSCTFLSLCSLSDASVMMGRTLVHCIQNME